MLCTRLQLSGCGSNSVTDPRKISFSQCPLEETEIVYTSLVVLDRGTDYENICKLADTGWVYLCFQF